MWFLLWRILLDKSVYNFPINNKLFRVLRTKYNDIFIPTCMYIRRPYIHTYVYMYTYIHTYIHTFFIPVHPSIQPSIHTHIHRYIDTCMHTEACHIIRIQFHCAGTNYDKDTGYDWCRYDGNLPDENCRFQPDESASRRAGYGSIMYAPFLEHVSIVYTYVRSIFCFGSRLV